MRNYVIINGVNSLTIQGLAIKTLPPITKPIQRNLREEIDGRDGDIVTTLGYGAYDKTIEIGLFGTFDIDEVIAYFNQKGTITFSNEADKVYYFEALDQVDYAELLKFRTANVVLHCQPFKYPLNETPLVEEYEYVEATGSDVTLDNTSEAIFNKIDLLGNTEQTQYTGKNLANSSLTELQSVNTSGSWNNGSYTKSGVTFTPVYKNGMMEYVNVNGTASADTNFYFGRLTPASASTSYTLNGCPSGGSSSTYRQWLDYIGGDYGSGAIGIPNVTTDLNIFIQIKNGYNAQNLKFKTMVRLTSITDNTYEPYVGGIPSPNPNYPQDIHVVSGDNEINICGKNLLDIDNWVKGRINNTTGNIEYASNVSSMVIGENNISFVVSQAWNSGITSDFIPISTGDYVFKYGHNREITMAIDTYDSQKKKIARIDAFTQTQTPTTRTYTISDSNVKYIRIHFEVNTANVEYIVSEMQLEKGSTSTTYEPYTGETYPLNLGVPNLIKETEATLGTISQSDGVTIGSSTSVYYIPSYINVKPNEAYSFKYNGTSNITIRAFYYNASKTYLSTAVVSGSSSNQVTFTIPTNAYYLRVQYGSGYYNQGLQLTKGSTPQTISNTPLEMASIPNTNNRDYFYKDNEGNWYKKALIEKIIIDGTESTWVENSATKGLFQITLTNTKNSPNTINAVSDWLRGAKGNDIGAATITSAINNTIATYNGNRLFFRIDQYKNNLAGLKTYIQSNNLTAYYLYGTPVDVAITNETLIEQLEAIKNAISYKGQTNISQTNNDMPFVLDLSALKENSDHLVIDNIGNIYSKPTLDLEGTGIVDIYLNDTQMFEVDLSEKNEIVIDTEKMEAYNPTDNTLANRQVTGDYSKFKLDSGENDLRFSGDLTKATITNYERWL